MTNRRNTIAMLTFVMFAMLVAVMMAVPRTARAENYSVTMRVGETVDIDSPSYGKHPDYTVNDCQFDNQIVSVSVSRPEDTLHIKGLKAGNTTIVVNMQPGSLGGSPLTERVPVTVLDHPTVTLSAGAGGSVSPAEPTRYPKDTTVNISATANPGYEFDKWTSISGTDVIDSSSPTASFAMPESDVSATATFKAIPYKVTTSTDGNGTLVASQSEGISVGTSVTLTATPAKGYRLKSITGTYQEGGETKTFTATESPHVFEMPASDVVAKAEFEAVFGVSVKPDPTEGGTVKADRETAVAGETVSLFATTNEGYEFVRWESLTSAVEIKDSKFTMPASDVEVKAVFKKKATPATTATLTFDLAGGTLDGKTGTYIMTAKVGETIKLPDAPTRAGYTFKCWKGSEFAAGAEYKVEGDHEFTAEYEAEVENGSATEREAKVDNGSATEREAKVDNGSATELKKGDYPSLSMSNSRGGSFTSISEEITYTVSQEVPVYATSLRTWVDLEDVLYLTTDEVTVQTEDGTVGSDVARVTIDGQRITVTMDDATSLRGKTLTFSYNAKLRSDADLSPYMNSEGNVASVPYQAHTVFDGNEDDVKHSNVERVNFRVSKSSPEAPQTTNTSSGGSTSSGSTSSGSTRSSSSSSSTLAKTGDATSFATIVMMAVTGAGLALAGRKRR